MLPLHPRRQCCYAQRTDAVTSTRLDCALSVVFKVQADRALSAVCRKGGLNGFQMPRS